MGSEMCIRDRGLPGDGLWLVLRLWGRLGRIQRDDYLERGVEVSASISGAHGWVNGDDTWLRGQAGVKAAWLGPKRLNLVARAVHSAQTRAHPEHRLFVGGYTALRGYAEGRFVGEGSGVLNVEARIPSIHRRWVVLQHVLFADAAAVYDGQAKLWQGGVSVGGGLRFIVPPLVGVVGRLDVAWAFHDQDWLLSFGAQQFF